MSIWKQPVTVSLLNKRGETTFIDALGIQFTNCTETSVSATCTVGTHHLQPMGIMNGGVSTAIAESVASAASNYCCDTVKCCVGLDINTNHIGAARSGEVLNITAQPYHLGKTTQVWGIEIRTKVRLISISRLTLLVTEKPTQ